MCGILASTKKNTSFHIEIRRTHPHQRDRELATTTSTAHNLGRKVRSPCWEFGALRVLGHEVIPSFLLHLNQVLRDRASLDKSKPSHLFESHLFHRNVVHNDTRGVATQRNQPLSLQVNNARCERSSMYIEITRRASVQSVCMFSSTLLEEWTRLRQTTFEVRDTTFRKLVVLTCVHSMCDGGLCCRVGTSLVVQTYFPSMSDDLCSQYV